MEIHCSGAMVLPCQSHGNSMAVPQSGGEMDTSTGGPKIDASVRRTTWEGTHHVRVAMAGWPYMYICIYLYICRRSRGSIFDNCMDLYGFEWICMDFHGFSWIFMDLNGFVWIWMDLNGNL